MSKRLIRPVIWIAAIHFAATVAFSFMVPIYWGPDEIAHVDRVQRAGERLGSPDPKIFGHIDANLQRTQRILGDPPPDRSPLRSTDIPERGTRPRFDQVDKSLPLSIQQNQLTQHPPLYYQATRAIGSTIGSLTGPNSWPWDREVLLYRWISALMLAPLPLLAGASMSMLGRNRTEQCLAAVTMASVGGLSFIGSIVNNDALAIAASSFAIFAVVGYHRTKNPRWIPSAALCCGAAALSKSTSLAVAVMVMLVLGISIGLNFRGRLAKLPFRALGVSALLFLIGCSWHIRQLINHGDIQPSAFVSDEADPDATVNVGRFLWNWVTRVTTSFWGETARRTGVTPFIGSVIASAVTVIVTFAAGMWRRVEHKFIVYALGVLAISQTALMFRSNLRRHLLSGGYSALQGRYLLPAILAVVIVSTLGAVRLSSWNRRLRTVWILALMACLAIVTHVTLGVSMINGYWGEADLGFSARFETLLAWSPYGNGVTIALILSPLVLGVLWALESLWGLRSRASIVVE